MTDVSPEVTLARPAGGVHRPDEITVVIAGPAPQKRLTVLLRLVLIVPHVIVLYALAIAAALVQFIGWFAALFTGRLPQGTADFLLGYLRWSTRVYAYESLLTDQYPPFELADCDYPVRVAASPGSLNRVAVFFRFLLAIPAGFLGSFVALGGRSPRSLPG